MGRSGKDWSEKDGGELGRSRQEGEREGSPRARGRSKYEWGAESIRQDQSLPTWAGALG